jgi:hypothetical protein
MKLACEAAMVKCLCDKNKTKNETANARRRLRALQLMYRMGNWTLMPPSRCCRDRVFAWLLSLKKRNRDMRPVQNNINNGMADVGALMQPGSLPLMPSTAAVFCWLELRCCT